MKSSIRVISSIDTINQIAVNVPHQPIRPSGQRKVYVTGWVFDGLLNNLVEEVFVCIGKCAFKAVYRQDRADVAKHYRNPLILQCGFFCNIPVDAFLDGENIVSIKVVVSNENEALYNINPIEIDVQKSFVSTFSRPEREQKIAKNRGNDPLISIVIPCFNDGKYLPDALSGIGEIKDVNYEVIIINDGSTDTLTLDYLEKLDKNTYIVIHQKNKGVSSARNAGIAIARGAYILALDADNMIKPDYVYTGTEFLENNPEFDIFYSDQIRFGITNRIIEVPEFDLISLISNNCVDTCAIFRKEVWETCGGYDENMVGFEDWELWMRAYIDGFKFYHHPEPLFFYREKSLEESLNLQCQIPANYTKLLSYIYAKHSRLIRQTLTDLKLANQDLHNELRHKDFQIYENITRQSPPGYLKNNLITKIKQAFFLLKAYPFYVFKHPRFLKNNIKSLFQQGLKKAMTLASHEILLEKNNVENTPDIVKSEKLEKLFEALSDSSQDVAGKGPVKVSVIICTYNRWSYLLDLLKSLGQQSYPHFEVIVVNGPSNDDTFRVKTLFPKVRYFETPQRNISISRNIGINLAQGEIIIFVDDDALPGDSEWISRFVTTFNSDRNIKAIGAPVKTGWTEEYEFYRAYGGFYGTFLYIWPNKYSETFDNTPKTKQFPFDTGQGSNIAFRKKELIEIGGFDEYFVYYLDEADATCRLFKKGYETYNLKENVQRHFRGPSIIRGNGYNLRWQTIARSTAYYGMKNGDNSFFIRIAQVIHVLLTDKSQEITANYKNKHISTFDLIQQLTKYYYGGILGILAGIFKKRKFLAPISDIPDNTYVNFNEINIPQTKYRIAVVAPCMESGETGGAERFHEGLTNALNTPTTSADLVKVVIDESNFQAIEASYLKCFNLDLSEYDAVISTKAPTFLVQHPNHVCYHQHTIRVYYDMFQQLFTDPSPIDSYHRNTIVKIDAEALKYPRTKKVFSQGYEIKERLQKWNGITSEVLHPAMHFDSIRSGSYDYVFMPGRLHPWKRVDLVIRAMRFIQLPVRLKISGTGEDLERLMMMAGGDDRIEFLGYVTDEVQAQLYSNALVVPFVPVREDYGYIALEAFAHEKPVITCKDSGEPLQFVKDGITGFVVEPNPKEIAKAIEYFIANPEQAKEMGNKGRQEIEHLINWSDISQKLIRCLQE